MSGSTVSLGDVVLNGTIREFSFDLSMDMDTDSHEVFRSVMRERTVMIEVSPRFPLKRGTPVDLDINGNRFVGTVRYRRLRKGVIDGRFVEK